MGKTNINMALLPLSWIYGAAVWVRNKLFDWKILPVEEFDVPVISVGNLAVGGTGKTPHIEYLVRLLKTDYRVAVLSRGYKRKTHGFIIADKTATARTTGDEPFQMFRKFPDITVAVDADRRRGIRRLLDLPENNRPEIILLDDAFQHRYVKPSLSILLTDYSRPFFKDSLLPAGRLREPAANAKRADIIIVTKCPANREPLPINLSQSLFYSFLNYKEIEPVFNGDKNIEETAALLVTGIANPAPVIRYLNNRIVGLRIMLYGDHHDFTKKDFEDIEKTFAAARQAKFAKNMIIISTEKDAARLVDNPDVPERLKPFWYYLPIETAFAAEDEKLFTNKIKQNVKEIIGNRSVATSANSKRH
jgi:tetraacyldisaccharide 4'-kinase